MKIVFEAFGGKLRSEPIDVPENTSDVFDMILDSGSFTRVGVEGDILKEKPSELKKCRFEWNGHYYAIPRTPSEKFKSARIYQLVEIG